MRKLRLRFSIFCLILLCLANFECVAPNFEVFKNATYCFCASEVGEVIADANVIKTGDLYFVTCSNANYAKVKNSLKNIDGESVRISNYTSDDLQKVVAKFKDGIKMTQNCGEYDFFMCYDPTLPKYVMIDGKKINIQIAISKTDINIGYPLILNGY